MLLAALAVSSAPALAFISRGHVFSSSFGEAGKGDGQLSEPSGVAVNEASGDVYVADFANNRVELFSSTGTYVSSIKKHVSEPTGIAIDNSHSTAPLEDPSAGDVYVMEPESGVIDKFTAEGTFVGRLTSKKEAEEFGEPYGVAVDADGVVWVIWASGTIESFSDAATNALLSSRAVESAGEPGLAVDSEDEIYVNTGTGIERFNSREPKLKPNGRVETEAVEPGEEAAGHEEVASGVAVDLSDNGIYIDDGTSVAAFRSDGSLIQRFGVGHLIEGSGIAVDSKTDGVYVADRVADKLEVFVPEPPGPPSASAFAQGMSSTSAKLNAEIDPTGSDTTYYFQYGTASCKTSPSSCADTPVPAGDVGAGFSDQSVSAELSDLQPDTVYDYRVLATNSFGTYEGPDQTFQTAAAATAQSCPNQPIREQQHSSYLQDCRAYELASPVLKDGNEVENDDDVNRQVPFQASAEGAGVVYQATGGLPGTPSTGFQPSYLAESSGPGAFWQTLPLNPESQFGLPPTRSGEARNTGEFEYFSPSLSCGIEATGLPLAMHPGEGTPQLAPGETAEEGIENLYAWDATNDTYTLVTNVKPENSQVYGVPVDGVSAGCTHVVFESEYQFDAAPMIPGESPLYEWSDGTLRVASVLPDGKPTDVVSPAGTGSKLSSEFNELSSDGSRVFFTAMSNEGVDSGHDEVFLRQNASSTIEVSGSNTTPAARDVGARFQIASTDGDHVFFTGSYGLTANSSTGTEALTECVLSSKHLAPGTGCDLYDYDVNTRTLTDLSPDREADTGDKQGADVRGVLGVSEDGSSVYFSASGQLVSGEGNTQAANTLNNEANVYVEHEGRLSFVASIGQVEAGSTTEQGVKEELDAIANSNGAGSKYTVSRVSANGEHLLFATKKRIAQSDGAVYDNRDLASGEPDVEQYEYSRATGSVTCVSCSPAGERPVTGQGGSGDLSPFSRVFSGSVPRNLDDAGQAFFDSFTPLVPQAANGTLNAYEWEPEGVGSCAAGRVAGCVSLLDSGTDPNPSYFEGASADGSNVYVTTFAPLAYPDEDGLRDIYDVRVDGGFPAPASSTPCSGAGCQGSSGPGLSVSTPGSVSQTAAGNLPSPAPTATGGVGAKGVKGFTARSVRGATVTVSISAPSKGRISASGAGLSSVRRSVARAGVYKLKISLTSRERKTLQRRKKLKLHIRVRFAPSTGASTSTSLSVTFMRA